MTWISVPTVNVGDIATAAWANDVATDLNALSFPAGYNPGEPITVVGVAGGPSQNPETIKISGYVTTNYTTGGLSITYAAPFPNQTDIVLFVSRIANQADLNLVGAPSAAGFTVKIENNGTEVANGTATGFYWIAFGQ